MLLKPAALLALQLVVNPPDSELAHLLLAAGIGRLVDHFQHGLQNFNVLTIA
ncbi:MAG: hypothetical protein KGO82_12205 [Bacteroidota bacterium]|nr:hypothetical protein [Bacteroidota bacterium]